MVGKWLFLKWALFASLISIGAFIASRLGWFGYVQNGDPTHITFITLGVFVLTTAWLGRVCWKFGAGDYQSAAHGLDSGWFASSVCVSLGLIGTVIGYFMMMQGVTGEGEEAAKELVHQIRIGMGTVLINTIVGGICGLLIELQSHFIGQAVKRIKP